MKILKTYECRIEDFFESGHSLISIHSGTTAAKARYSLYLQHSDVMVPYSECYKFIKQKSLGRIIPEHFFSSKTQFERVCKSRRIEFARQGMIIDVAGKKGWIVGGNSHMNLDVLFEGQGHTSNCHPTWETTYYKDDMNIIKNFKN